MWQDSDSRRICRDTVGHSLRSSARPVGVDAYHNREVRWYPAPRVRARPGQRPLVGAGWVFTQTQRRSWVLKCLSEKMGFLEKPREETFPNPGRGWGGPSCTSDAISTQGGSWASPWG